MKKLHRHHARIAAMALLVLVQSCAAASVAGTVVGSTVKVTKVAVKGTVGAGKLVYRGGKAVGRTVTGGGGYTSNNDYAYSGESYQDYDDNTPSCLNPDGSYSPALRGASGEYFCPN